MAALVKKQNTKRRHPSPKTEVVARLVPDADIVLMMNRLFRQAARKHRRDTTGGDPSNLGQFYAQFYGLDFYLWKSPTIGRLQAHLNQTLKLRKIFEGKAGLGLLKDPKQDSASYNKSYELWRKDSADNLDNLDKIVRYLAAHESDVLRELNF